MAESGLTPKAERRVTGMFNYINAHPTLWKVGMNVGAKMAGLMIKMAQLQSRSVYSMIGWHHVISQNPMVIVSVSWFKRHKAEGKKIIC